MAKNTTEAVAADRAQLEADRVLAEAVRRDSWYVLGGMRARIDLLTRQVTDAKKSMEMSDPKMAIYSSLESMVWEAERIIREYREAMDRLQAAGLKA